MRAVDANVLVHARREEASEHRINREVIQGLSEGSEPWVLAWACIFEFLRVMTHPRVFNPPTPTLRAWEGVETLLDSPSCIVISEGARHREIVRGLIQTVPLTGNILHDAHVAALLIEHGVDEIITADNDFRRFPQLKVTNPFRR